MKHALILVCLFLCLALSFSVAAQVPDTGLHTGELASGSIQPVPGGELVIGVADGGIEGMGGKTVISGPPGFLISMGEGPGFNVEGRDHLGRWGAVFLPGNVKYTL